jgi:hypothetical protein
LHRLAEAGGVSIIAVKRLEAAGKDIHARFASCAISPGAAARGVTGSALNLLSAFGGTAEMAELTIG